LVGAAGQFVVPACGNSLGQCNGRFGFQIHKRF
jgi:hypothetical protein